MHFFRSAFYFLLYMGYEEALPLKPSYSSVTVSSALLLLDL